MKFREGDRVIYRQGDHISLKGQLATIIREDPIFNDYYRVSFDDEALNNMIKRVHKKHISLVINNTIFEKI